MQCLNFMNFDEIYPAVWPARSHGTHENKGQLTLPQPRASQHKLMFLVSHEKCSIQIFRYDY